MSGSEDAEMLAEEPDLPGRERSVLPTVSPVPLAQLAEFSKPRVHCSAQELYAALK